MDRRGRLTLSSLSFVAAAGALGLVLGSFLNVVVWRLPQMQAGGLVRHGQPLRFLALPLSRCPHCMAPILPLHNIPVLSFLFLRGRAACCNKPISACYPLIEIGGAFIAAWSAWRLGPGLDFALAVVFLSVLLVISVIDMRRYYILDVLVLPLLWLGLLANLDARFALLSDAVAGAAGGYACMRALSAAGAAIFRRPVMGGGDAKLMAALGAWLGWQLLPFVLFFASAGGVCYFFLLRLTRSGRGRLSGRMCFAPALSLAGAVMMFYGDEVLAAYLAFAQP